MVSPPRSRRRSRVACGPWRRRWCSASAKSRSSRRRRGGIFWEMSSRGSGKSWKNHGKSWQVMANHGKIMEYTSTTMENTWKIMGNTWNNHGKSWNIAIFQSSWAITNVPFSMALFNNHKISHIIYSLYVTFDPDANEEIMVKLGNWYNSSTNMLGPNFFET